MKNLKLISTLYANNNEMKFYSIDEYENVFFVEVCERFPKCTIFIRNDTCSSWHQIQKKVKNVSNKSSDWWKHFAETTRVNLIKNQNNKIQFYNDSIYSFKALSNKKGN